MRYFYSLSFVAVLGLSAHTSSAAPFCASLFVEQSNLFDRVESFLEKHSEQTRIISEVKFNFDASNKQFRRVLLIQYKGDKDPIVQDYLRMLGDNSISFPTGERTEHIYVRSQDKVYDFFNILSKRDYMIRAKRLEPVIELTPKELQRMQEYLETGAESLEGLGQFDAQGPKPGANSKRDLNDNRFDRADCKHNCTSWISMAPIGDRSTYLIELLGGDLSSNVHRRAGQWIHWLVGASPSNRIPFVVVWTARPIQKVEAEISRGQLLWDFGQRSEN